MNGQHLFLIVLIIAFIVFEVFFSFIFSIFIFKFVTDKRKRNKIMLNYGFVSLITVLFVILAIVHHLLNV